MHPRPAPTFPNGNSNAYSNVHGNRQGPAPAPLASDQGLTTDKGQSKPQAPDQN